MYHQKPLLGELPDFSHPLTPTAAWVMNEGSGNKIFDLINSNHGTITGATWDIGEKGSVLNFGTTDHYAHKASPITPYTDQYTLQIICKKNTWDGTYDYFFDQGYAAGVILYTSTVTYPPANMYRYYVDIGGTDYIANFGTASLSGWHNITFTYNGSKFYVYLDGVESTSFAASGILGGSTNDIYIGCYSGGGAFSANAAIESIMQWNRYTPPSQISQLYINPYCWLAQPFQAELMYAAPPVGVMSPFYYEQLMAGAVI